MFTVQFSAFGEVIISVGEEFGFLDRIGRVIGRYKLIRLSVYHLPVFIRLRVDFGLYLKLLFYSAEFNPTLNCSIHEEFVSVREGSYQLHQVFLFNTVSVGLAISLRLVTFGTLEVQHDLEVPKVVG